MYSSSRVEVSKERRRSAPGSRRRSVFNWAQVGLHNYPSLCRYPGLPPSAIYQCQSYHIVLGSSTALDVAILRIGDCVDIILQKDLRTPKGIPLHRWPSLAQSLLWYCREISAKAVSYSTTCSAKTSSRCPEVHTTRDTVAVEQGRGVQRCYATRHHTMV